MYQMSSTAGEAAHEQMVSALPSITPHSPTQSALEQLGTWASTHARANRGQGQYDYHIWNVSALHGADCWSGKKPCNWWYSIARRSAEDVRQTTWRRKLTKCIKWIQSRGFQLRQARRDISTRHKSSHCFRDDRVYVCLVPKELGNITDNHVPPSPL